MSKEKDYFNVTKDKCVKSVYCPECDAMMSIYRKYDDTHFPSDAKCISCGTVWKTKE